MAEITLVEAVNLALARALTDEPSVIVLGEDVGPDGGVFRATEGLFELFGPERVIDTPLAEAAIGGVAVGLAAEGMRPVAEIQFSGFAYPVLDQLISHATRLRNRTRGRLTCPLVIRAPFGGGVHAPEHHSESMEALYAHVPGLRVVIPSSPTRAYGLLLAAIASPDPVVFLEPKRLYRAGREEVADDGQPLPLDHAFTLRSGDDLTLVTWGAMVRECTQVARTLADDGVGVDLIDVATVAPLDFETVIASVSRTGRCLIVHEAPLTGGVGAEIAARLASDALLSLLAPVTRIGGYDTVMPLPKLEAHYMPSAARILTAAQEVLAYS